MKNVFFTCRELCGTLRCASFLALITVASSISVFAATPTKFTTQLDMRTVSAMQALQRYSSSHSFSDLRSAISTMQTAADIGSLTPTNFIAERRTLVHGWALILKAIEQSYDPTFHPNNPSDVPNSCVVPPREPSGRQAPACADPEEVQDPKARADYISAIKANDLKRQRTNRYRQLFNIDEEAMSSLEMTLTLLRKIAPEGATPDFPALDGILRQAGLSQSRREQIDRYFYAGGAP
jgi:hypothetical protein